MPTIGIASAALKQASDSWLRFTSLEDIGRWPQTWPDHVHGTRKFVLQRFPCAVIYREKESAVQILAVAHGHRRPGYWKDRI